MGAAGAGAGAEATGAGAEAPGAAATGAAASASGRAGAARPGSLPGGDGDGGGDGAGEGRARRALGAALCMVTILLAVLDLYIVSAATVPIVRELDPEHGVDTIPWLVSAYALASTAVLPLYGKLCDTLGAKRVFLTAVAVFLLGSSLCGAAQSMLWLILARGLQGMGGGGLMSVTMVVLAQLRGGGRPGSRGGGLGGLVAGAAMAVGPWVGGALADHADWRWIFYVNLPVGIAVLVGSAFVLRLPRPAHPGTIGRLDWLGALLGAAFSSALLLVLQWGGDTYAWTSPAVIGLACAAAGALVLFLWRQARAAEPVLPLSVFRPRVLRYGFAVQGLLGLSMTGALVYVLIYLQVARGISSASAGLFLIPMALGMTAVGLVAGRLSARGVQARVFALVGAGCAALALALLGTLGPHSSLWLVRCWLLLLGLGFGQLVGQLILLVQSTAPRGQLGVATTGVRLFQTLGNSLGAALFGTLLSRQYAAHGPGGSTSSIGTLTGAAHSEAVAAFVSATDTVFRAAAVVMALAALLALRLPRTRTAGA